MGTLAQLADVSSSPFEDLIRRLSVPQQQSLIDRASRSIESMAGRRLAPFQITETSRAQAIDPDESIGYSFPLDQTAALGMSRARSLGSPDLVRHCWVRNRPPIYQELWTGALVSISAYLTVASVVSIPLTNAQFEPDLGHIRLSLGSFVPMGSTLSITYTGGYSTVPDDLVLATMMKAAALQLLTLDPESRQHDLDELNGEIASLISPYVADGDD